MSEAVLSLILDDDAPESDVLAELLDGVGDDLQCSPLQPSLDAAETVATVRERLQSGRPRILLLDYRLEDNPIADGTHVEYRGGTIAGSLRDADPDLPIVLLTSEEKLHQWVERRPGMKHQFDFTLIKREVGRRDHAPAVQARLVDFARTWLSATGWPDDAESTWGRLAELMHAPDDGMEPFVKLEAEPPRGDVPGDVLHWLLHRARRFRGPLVDAATVRVLLGLAPESFADDAVQTWLEPAAYTGALAAFGDRWWAHVVRALLAEACGGTRLIDASERAGALSSAIRTDVEPEGCTWCGGERTVHACALCEQAIDAAHALAPLGPPLPAWAEPSVVCFRCVSEGRATALRFAPASEAIVADIVEDRLRPLV